MEITFNGVSFPVKRDDIGKDHKGCYLTRLSVTLEIEKTWDDDRPYGIFFARNVHSPDYSIQRDIRWAYRNLAEDVEKVEKEFLQEKVYRESGKHGRVVLHALSPCKACGINYTPAIGVPFCEPCYNILDNIK